MFLGKDIIGSPVISVSDGRTIGKVKDVYLTPDCQSVLGFSLSHTFVSGPIAEKRAIACHAVQDVGSEDGAMTIDLKQAEQQQLSVT